MTNGDEIKRRLSEKMSGEIDTIQDKLRDLETVSGDSAGMLGGEASALLGELNSKMRKIQAEIKDLKVGDIMIY